MNYNRGTQISIPKGIDMPFTSSLTKDELEKEDDFAYEVASLLAAEMDKMDAAEKAAGMITPSRNVNEGRKKALSRALERLNAQP